MKIAMMTNSFQGQRETSERRNVIDCVRRLASLGYKYQDLSLTSLMWDGTEFHQDDWYERACAIRDEAEKLGVKFVQGHLPFRMVRFNPKCEDEVKRDHDINVKAAKIAAICGAEWMVAHPVEDYRYPHEATEKHIEENKRIYSETIEELFKGGVGIAFENVPDRKYRRFGATATDLCNLVDSYNDDKIKICWDFGHANITYGESQSYALKLVGNRLRCVHVQDNNGSNDDHFIPFAGNINWEEIMKVVKEIGYDRYWVPEVVFANRFPDYMRDDISLFIKGICEELIKLYDKA